MRRHSFLSLVVVLASLFAQDTSAPNRIPDERGIGSKGAPIVIEVFSDFQCHGCAGFYLQTLTRVIEDYCNKGKVYLIHREYPLPTPSHRYARDAARWALACAAIGRYERAATALFLDQSIWSQNGDIESTIASVLTPAELARAKQVMKENGEEIGPHWNTICRLVVPSPSMELRHSGLSFAETKSLRITTSRERIRTTSWTAIRV